MSTPTSITISLDQGPALVYLHSDRDTVTIVDKAAVSGNRRERAICRALLLTALELLDATEPTNPNQLEGRRG